MLSRPGIAALVAQVGERLPSSVPPPTRYLLPLLSATTLGHGAAFIRPCLDSAYSGLAATPCPVPPEPLDARLDRELHPRRFVSRLVKESLVKSAILIGVPKAIETLLDLSDAVHPGDRSQSFVRQDLDQSSSARFRDRSDAGRRGLASIYQGNIDDIFDKFKAGGLEDVRFFSEHLTYGTFLTPFPASSASGPSRDPFASDPRLLSLVTLSCLIPQSTPREIHWHLRGALRRGWTRDEVEAVHAAIDAVCERLGTRLDARLPRVKDVERQAEEGEARGGPP
ncbi:hypothetical protein JCM11491_004126 [Sporobolomyces phaffii]